MFVEIAADVGRVAAFAIVAAALTFAALGKEAGKRLMPEWAIIAVVLAVGVVGGHLTGIL